MDTSSLLAQLPQAGELPYLIFPAALLIYYLICWLLVGRDPKMENGATQCDTEGGISRGVARYILTGGSDGTTLAAILADLAAKQVISVQPEGHSYRIKLLNDRATVMPEGATALKSLLGVELAACPYSVAVTAKSGITLQPPKPSTAIFGHHVLESSMGTTVPHSPPPPDETVAPPTPRDYPQSQRSTGHQIHSGCNPGNVPGEAEGRLLPLEFRVRRRRNDGNICVDPGCCLDVEGLASLPNVLAPVFHLSCRIGYHRSLDFKAGPPHSSAENPVSPGANTIFPAARICDLCGSAQRSYICAGPADLSGLEQYFLCSDAGPNC